MSYLFRYLEELRSDIMQCYCHSVGPAVSHSSCSRELPGTGGCLHSYPAKRVKLRPPVSKSATRKRGERRKDMLCLAHSFSQVKAAAVAERPTEAPASSIPVQLLTSSRSPELLRIRHSVSFASQHSSCTARYRHAVRMNPSHHLSNQSKCGHLAATDGKPSAS